MAESTQKKLGRVRPPRVQITYDVETGDAIERKELPFVVGIMADLGRSEDGLPPIKERNFVEIDRDNIDQVLGSIAPRVVVKVDNVLPDRADDEVNINAVLSFGKVDDFEPVPLLLQIAPLNQLYRARCNMRDFLAKLDGNDALDGLLGRLLYDAEDVTDLKASLLTEGPELLTKLEANLDAALIKNLPTKLTQQIAAALETEEFTLATLKDDASAEKLATMPEEYQKQLAKELAALNKVKTVHDVPATHPGWEDVWNGLWDGVEIPDSFNTMIADGEMVQDASQKRYTAMLVRQFVADTLATFKAGDIPEEGVKPDASALGNSRIADIDEAVSRQLNLVIHDPAFQKLEATWRGLHYLVMNSETGTQLKLRVLNASDKELLTDLTKAVEFDQSALFRKVYEQEYGTYGGNPYSMLVGDFQFGRHPDDMLLLEGLAGVAASAHAPFVGAAYAKLFDMDDFSKLYKPRDLSKIFESAELIKWRSFRESEDSRYVTLTLPKVLLRLPYGQDTKPVEGLNFEEDVAGEDASKYLWGNPSFVLAQRITNAFSLYGWTAAIRGVEGGGLIEGLPAHTFKTDAGDIALTCPTQVAITDRREKELNDLGFMAICHCKGTDKAAFFGGSSTNQPKKYNTDEANANARISAMLPYVLSASRFAHYIKVIMREKVGKFLTRSNVEDYLNTWIAQYILLDDTPPQDIKAKFPLREARVTVTDVAGKPGCYRATVFLRPHFQLEELTTSIRLVAELPA